jgi:probable HAF family extracellular repeat protein
LDEGPQAFRWENGEMVGLGDLPGGDFYSTANAVSPDGSVVVGLSHSGSYYEAFRWENEQMTGLGNLYGDRYSEAEDVSANGLVVVGHGGTPLGDEAFRWENGQMVGLGDLPGGAFYSHAFGVSADGSIVVSADGSIVVGTSPSDLNSEAFLWNTDDGMMSLKYVLENQYGLDLTGWNLACATAISDNGLNMVGYGTNPDGNWEAWLARIPGPTNSPPVADAGDDQIVYLCADGAAEVELDGSGSTDADGDELEYYWTWEIEGAVFDANGVSPIIELPVGLHTIELTVDDGVEVSEPNWCVIEVIEGIEVDLRVMPRVINRKSRMRRILAVVQLPGGIDGDDIDGSFWLYPGEIEPHFSRLTTVNGSQKLFMVFDKSLLVAVVGANGAVVLEIEGKLISGECLYGSDRIKIIRRGRGPKDQTGLRKGTPSRRNRIRNSR